MQILKAETQNVFGGGKKANTIYLFGAIQIQPEPSIGSISE